MSGSKRGEKRSPQLTSSSPSASRFSPTPSTFSSSPSAHSSQGGSGSEGGSKSSNKKKDPFSKSIQNVIVFEEPKTGDTDRIAPFLHSIIKNQDYQDIPREGAIDVFNTFNLEYCTRRVELRHPNIVRAFMPFTFEDVSKLEKWNPNRNEDYVLLVERCDGTLPGVIKEFLDPFGRIGGEKCRNLISQIAKALEYLHSNDFIHGDMTLGDIFYATPYDKDKPAISSARPFNLKLRRAFFVGNASTQQGSKDRDWSSFGKFLSELLDYTIDKFGDLKACEFQNLADSFKLKSLTDKEFRNLKPTDYVLQHPAFWTTERSLFLNDFVEVHLKIKIISRIDIEFLKNYGTNLAPRGHNNAKEYLIKMRNDVAHPSEQTDSTNKKTSAYVLEEDYRKRQPQTLMTIYKHCVDNKIKWRWSC